MTPMPNNVVDNFLSFISFIKSKKEILLQENQVSNLLMSIGTLKWSAPEKVTNHRVSPVGRSVKSALFGVIART
jgi:hypothetical protein